MGAGFARRQDRRYEPRLFQSCWHAAGQPGGPAPGRFDVRQLRRSRDDRMIGGVCGGLGRYVGIDPIIFRIVLAALAIFGGVGLLLYALGWLLIPEDGADVSELHRLFQGHPSPAPIIAAIVVGVLGVITVTEIAYHRRGRFEVLLIVVAVVAVVALTSRSRGIPPATAVTPPPYGTPPRPPYVTPPPSYERQRSRTTARRLLTPSHRPRPKRSTRRLNTPPLNTPPRTTRRRWDRRPASRRPARSIRRHRDTCRHHRSHPSCQARRRSSDRLRSASAS